jgi:ankyrin repeat protein
MKGGDEMALEGSIWSKICFEKYDSVRELMHNNEFDPNYIEGGKSLLHLIAKTMEVDIAKSLLDRGADVDIRDAYGNTPVMEALARYDKNDFKDDAMVKLLFENGASRDSVNNYDRGVQNELDIVRRYSGKVPSWLDNK